MAIPVFKNIAKMRPKVVPLPIDFIALPMCYAREIKDVS